MHTRDGVHTNAPFLQVQHLLAAAAEDEGVPALQAQHAVPRLRKLAEHLVDLSLCGGVEAHLLAHIDHARAAVHQAKDVIRDQPVITVTFDVRVHALNQFTSKT